MAKPERVSDGRASSDTTASRGEELDPRAFARSLIEATGLVITIEPGQSGAGVVAISYFNADQLEWIAGALLAESQIEEENKLWAHAGLGERIQKVRIGAGLTTDAVAAALKITSSAVRQW